MCEKGTFLQIRSQLVQYSIPAELGNDDMVYKYNMQIIQL